LLKTVLPFINNVVELTGLVLSAVKLEIPASFKMNGTPNVDLVEYRLLLRNLPHLQVAENRMVWVSPLDTGTVANLRVHGPGKERIVQ
jgi:hypothetical protein